MRLIVRLFATIIAGYFVKSASAHSDQQYQDFFKARNVFTGNLVSAIDHKSNNQNVVISTFGIHSALSSVLAGAQGDTFKQLWNALGFTDTTLSPEAVFELYQETFQNITKLHDLGLNFANLFVVDDGLEIKDQFKNLIDKRFGAGLLKEDFKRNPEKATKDINDWVNEITEGKIAKLFDSVLNKGTVAVIANALYFKSSWLNEFDEKRSFNGSFNLKNGSLKNVTYMKISSHRLKRSRYSQSNGFRSVQIPFDRTGRLWFGIKLPVLPDSQFDSTSAYYIQEAEEKPVELTFPKFDIFQNHKNLIDILKGMGVKDLFDSSIADLSGINGQRNLCVSEIVQKATVTINEHGAEATAATEISILLGSSPHSFKSPIEFVVDRPFIFTINDRLTGIDFFTGIVYEP